MKRFKSILSVMIAAALLLAVSAGCSSGGVKWDELKRDDVVAEANGIQLSKKLVTFQNNIEQTSNSYTSSFYSQLGGSEDIDLEADMDTSLKNLLANLALASVAKDMGLSLSYEEAHEKAYDEYILTAKKYDYISSFADSLKESMFLSDELLVDYGAEYNVIVDSGEQVVRAEFEKLNADDFEDLDAMTEAVLERVNELAANTSVTVYYPSKHEVRGSGMDFSTAVNTVKWNYSSLFY